MFQGIDDNEVVGEYADFGRNIEKDSNKDQKDENNNFMKDPVTEERKRQGGRADVVLVSRALWDLKKSQVIQFTTTTFKIYKIQ